ncbi:hypothetical protein Pan216_12690 [Planctomycetes bacterium Pan216]|uniref:Helix-turn-helix domain protein n=1 Tax=Kolteria novifilia TaxID=2527975 RepID=A0A518B0D1_9BACT|nr:hypothetical protein Pan216_12690 [Planctomycetes bacterium Pan216]
MDQTLRHVGQMAREIGIDRQTLARAMAESRAKPAVIQGGISFFDEETFASIKRRFVAARAKCEGPL